jgi:predicted transcriptional regulator
MSPPMGRPKAENPKSKQIMVRLDAETDRKLEELAEFFKEKKVAVVRRGIEKLYAEIKK